jgi:hypothetical protein
MFEANFRGRRAATLENQALRVTILEQGGHIAEVLDKATAVNPLWIPPWPSIEPSSYDIHQHPEFGSGSDAKLLAGIMGHNLCLDLFGGPSSEEAAAGITVHGEGSVVRYDLEQTEDNDLTCTAVLPLAQLRFQRRITLDQRVLMIREAVENLSSSDRPIAWTQHVTLGPPFLEKGVTQFRISATRSKVFESAFGAHDYLKAGEEFDWPLAPRLDGRCEDLQVYNVDPASSAYTAHLMSPQRNHAFFVAFSRTYRLAFGYVWKRRDFPWLGIWEENHSRGNSPWNGKTLTRGLEFGVSPMPESRKQTVERGKLFGESTYRWLPAKSRITTEYCVVMNEADSIPETLDWPA